MTTSTHKTTAHSNSLLRAVLSVVQTVVILALVIISLMTFGARIPWLARFGMSFFAVTSGSMEPNIPTGALIYAGKYDPEKLKENDVITFTLNPAEGSEPVVVTHRIVKVDKTEETKEGTENVDDKKFITYAFTTKGDANSSNDQLPVGAGDIIGLYKWHVPLLGYVSIFAQKPVGFILLVVLPAIILIVWEAISLFLHFTKHSRLQSEKEIEKLKAELEQHKNQND